MKSDFCMAGIYHSNNPPAMELAEYNAPSAFTVNEEKLLQALPRRSGLVILDINLPDQSGFRALQQIGEQLPPLLKSPDDIMITTGV